MRQDGEKTVIQLMAEDYDVDIDRKLDAIRTHRSRVNLLTDITPIGITQTLCFETGKTPTVYTPFNREASQVHGADGLWHIRLPEHCSYVLIVFA